MDSERVAPPAPVASCDSLADLPIEISDAMYSPDFVELTTIAPDGTPLALPMSFTLDLPGNCLRFSSPVTAARIANLARDPRCCVSFSRVTTGHPPVTLLGVAILGETIEGVQRGPARRFDVTPRRVVVLTEPPTIWQTWSPASAPAAESQASQANGTNLRPLRRAPPSAAGDIATLLRFETLVAALRDGDGHPLNVPVDARADDGAIVAALPADVDLRDGPASLLGHTWTKAGPRYLTLLGRASINAGALRFVSERALRRP